MRIGIDLGGTSVKAALCADDGAILIKQGVPTKTGDPDGLRADMKQLALALCASGGVTAGRGREHRHRCARLV